jgi:6-phosphogluconolactonase
MGRFFFAAHDGSFAAPQPRSPVIMRDLLVYVGTYTEHTPDGSKGIYRARLDATTGRLGALEVAAELENPSFLALSHDDRFLYAVSETGAPDASGRATGGVAAYRVGDGGRLTEINRVPSGGADPCHITVSRSGRTVAVANYTGGSTATFRVRDDGGLVAATLDQHVGHGPNEERQEKAHAHSVGFSADDRLLLSCDLGADRVYVYRHDPRTSVIAPHAPAFVAVEPGSGPRHLAFHPSRKYAYVIAELANTIATFAWNEQAGTLVQRQRISTLPPNYATSPSFTAEIVAHPSGRFVYGTNRGHDTIAHFSVDARDGRLTRVGETPSGGSFPRGCAVDPSGRWLFAANQNAGTVVGFAVDQKTGALAAVGSPVKVPRACCVIFMPSSGTAR